MNLLYEGMKERGSLMVVPSTMVEAAGNLGMYAGLAALGTNLDGKAPVVAAPRLPKPDEPH